jgi:hypothetical protein
MCTEALLDIEYILALASPIPLEVYYDSTFSLFGWMKTILNDPEAPWVHSVSYGNDERQQISKAYMQSVDAQFQKIGVRGISILIASGDQGVWGRSGPGGKFNPDFPAGSAFVTAVGGTDLKTDVFQKEVGCKDGGGGFSDTFLVPPYQQEAVNQFKSISGSSLPAANLWNAQVCDCLFISLFAFYCVVFVIPSLARAHATLHSSISATFFTYTHRAAATPMSPLSSVMMCRTAFRRAATSRVWPAPAPHARLWRRRSPSSTTFASTTTSLVGCVIIYLFVSSICVALCRGLPTPSLVRAHATLHSSISATFVLVYSSRFPEPLPLPDGGEVPQVVQRHHRYVVSFL